MSAVLLNTLKGDSAPCTKEQSQEVKDRWPTAMVCTEDLLNDPTAMIMEVTSMHAIGMADNLWDEARSISPAKVLMSSSAPMELWIDTLTASVTNKTLTEGILSLRTRNGRIAAKPRTLPEQINAKRAASRAANGPTLPNGEKIRPTVSSTIRTEWVSPSLPKTQRDKILAIVKGKITWQDEITWADSPPRLNKLAAPTGWLPMRQGRWTGDISIASNTPEHHENLWRSLEGLVITLGMQTLHCQVSNSEGKKYVTAAAIA